MEYLNFQTLILPMATSMAAFGFNVPKPRIIEDLQKTVWFPWVLMFILVWQGGAGRDPVLAAITVLVMFVLARVLDMVYPKSEGFYQYN